MKAVSTALKNHLAQTVTTIATCWRIIRQDNQSFAFTSFDKDLVISGVTYLSTSGFTRTAIQTGSTGEVDNLQVVGFFTDAAVTAQDIKNGLFDYATIFVFAVNWADLSQGIIRLRHGWIGECTISPAGAFLAELRGMTQALVQEFGLIYSPICRADLGDARCKIPIRPAAWAANTAYNKGDYICALTENTDALLQAIFVANESGTSGSVEPTWDTTVGHVSGPDNGIEWISAAPWRTLGTVVSPLSQKQFVSTALSFPAAPPTTGLDKTAAVSFRKNVASGTAVTISDGLVSHSLHALADTNLSAALGWFWLWISSIHDWQITAQLIGNNVYLTNNSGSLGSVTKTGDTQNAIVIRDFVSNPIDGGVLTWLTGQNAGRSMEVKNVDVGSNTVTFWLGMYFPIQTGDKFLVYPGCDKRRDTCYFTFNNIVNFRAEPDMPTLDKVLSYPDA